MEKLLEENYFCQQIKIRNDEFQNEQNWEEISNQMNSILMISHPKQYINKLKQKNKKNNIFPLRQSQNILDLRQQKQIFDNQKYYKQQEQVKHNNHFIKILEHQLINSSKKINKDEQFQQKIKMETNLLKNKLQDFIQQKQIQNYQENKKKDNSHMSFLRIQSLMNDFNKQLTFSTNLISHNFCKLIQNQRNKKRLIDSRKKRYSSQNARKQSFLKVSKNSCKYLDKQQKKQIKLQQKQDQRSLNNQMKLRNSNTVHESTNIIHFQKNKNCLSVRSKKNTIKGQKSLRKNKEKQKKTKQKLKMQKYLHPCQKEPQKENNKSFNKQKLSQNIQLQIKKQEDFYSKRVSNKTKKSISFIIQKRIMKLEQKLKQSEGNAKKVRLSSLQNSPLLQLNKQNSKNLNKNQANQKLTQLNMTLLPSIKSRSLSQNLKTRQYPKSKFISELLKSEDRHKQPEKRNIIQLNQFKKQNLVSGHEQQTNFLGLARQKNLQLFKLRITDRTNKLIILRK